jgi:hypothetical protein
MTHVFKLTGEEKGKNKIILDKYVFTDGELQVNDDDTAAKYARILCEYYAVEKTVVTEPVPEEPTESSVSIAKTVTKTAAK